MTACWLQRGSAMVEAAMWPQEEQNRPRGEAVYAVWEGRERGGMRWDEVEEGEIWRYRDVWVYFQAVFSG